MKRTDLAITMGTEDGDTLAVCAFDTGTTVIGIADAGGMAAAHLDDDEVKQLRDHLTMILETEPRP